MSDTAIHEMISAFAAGCMDEKNHLYFKEYLEDHGALPEKKLGELQNIMSLLPMLLEQEEVPADLKKNVAKKLLGLQSEIKEKIRTEKKKTMSGTQSSLMFKEPPGKKAESPESEKPDTDNNKLNPAGNEAVTHISGDDLVSSSFPPSGLNLQEKLARRKDMSLNNEGFVLNRNHWLGIFGLVSAIVAIIVALFLVYRILDGRVQTVVDNFKAVESEITLNTDFRENYFSLMRFFNNTDVIYYNLKNVENANEASAKVFISFEEKTGLIQLSHMPTLSDEQTYQLWLRTPARDYSLGTFLPNPGRQFQEINDISGSVNQAEVEMLFITPELKPGNNVPEGRILIQDRVKTAVQEEAR